jgi:hypothetical protein
MIMSLGLAADMAQDRRAGRSATDVGRYDFLAWSLACNTSSAIAATSCGCTFTSTGIGVSQEPIAKAAPNMRLALGMSARSAIWFNACACWYGLVMVRASRSALNHLPETSPRIDHRHANTAITAGQTPDSLRDTA